jgi:hypothetical protein
VVTVSNAPAPIAVLPVPVVFAVKSTLTYCCVVREAVVLLVKKLKPTPVLLPPVIPVVDRTA